MAKITSIKNAIKTSHRILTSTNPIGEAGTIIGEFFKPNAIDNMTSRIKNYGLASANKFKVIINPPAFGRIESKITANSKFVSMSCINAALPGTSFQTHERKIKGPFTHIPYAKSYDNITLSFLVSQNMQEKIFFDAWQNLIMNHNDEFNFYNEYISTIIVQQLNKDLDMVYEVVLEDAYPIVVAPLPFDAASSGQLHKLDITFVYHRWHSIDQNVTTDSGHNTSVIGDGIKNATRGINKLSNSYNNYRQLFNKSTIDTSNLQSKVQQTIGDIF